MNYGFSHHTSSMHCTKSVKCNGKSSILYWRWNDFFCIDYTLSWKLRLVMGSRGEHVIKSKRSPDFFVLFSNQGCMHIPSILINIQTWDLSYMLVSLNRFMNLPIPKYVCLKSKPKRISLLATLAIFSLWQIVWIIYFYKQILLISSKANIITLSQLIRSTYFTK